MAFTAYCDAGGRNSRPYLEAAASSLAKNASVMGGGSAEGSWRESTSPRATWRAPSERPEKP
jgi:hypothetical protein